MQSFKSTHKLCSTHSIIHNGDAICTNNTDLADIHSTDKKHQNRNLVELPLFQMALSGQNEDSVILGLLFHTTQ